MLLFEVDHVGRGRHGVIRVRRRVQLVRNRRLRRVLIDLLRVLLTHIILILSKLLLQCRCHLAIVRRVTFPPALTRLVII